ncbi:ROK family transcriptional regulator [Marinactinospora thermotolerans]|uniref:Sugar kinase of the NBD/HSP70 family, may contain an N-terminal HTH domain n=1 Tax=Marinactinospora thermotolerans DSM 45154 TaxID=1122192 RepID=A0A1T4S7J5_9ACTN|nr:ROK family transcriptional regulator [Marinactinospora thermotolerans]SKA23801.1 Sugar kinase of the NBD/HSP70 family, may contain an N-terminal HTH domain [Marinactinospora thermotolerans DSM 45154]
MATDAEVTPGSQAALRQANRQRVVEALRAAGTMTQAEIARATGLSAASVSNIVRDLRSLGTVSVRETSSNGRRARAVTLVRPPGVVVGIDFAFSRITVALGDSQGRTLLEETIVYDVASDAGRGVRRAVWLVETLLTQARIDHSTVIGVAAAVPGPVDAVSGEIGTITCMPRWAGARPGEELAERLGLPVAVENDANLAVLAEAAEGVARGREHVIHVSLSQGVGAGLLVSGRLFRGAGGTAGEIGHIGLDERGQVCRCGNRGCLETLVGEPYLLAMLPQLGHVEDLATLGDVVAAARDADPGCRRIVAEAGAALGRGVAIVVNMFNPQMVVVGGELADAEELFLEPMRRAMELGTLGSALRDVRVVRGELGARAALRGALRLALSTMGESIR